MDSGKTAIAHLPYHSCSTSLLPLPTSPSLPSSPLDKESADNPLTLDRDTPVYLSLPPFPLFPGNSALLTESSALRTDNPIIPVHAPFPLIPESSTLRTDNPITPVHPPFPLTTDSSAQHTENTSGYLPCTDSSAQHTESTSGYPPCTDSSAQHTESTCGYLPCTDSSAQHTESTTGPYLQSSFLQSSAQRAESVTGFLLCTNSSARGIEGTTRPNLLTESTPGHLRMEQDGSSSKRFRLDSSGGGQDLWTSAAGKNRPVGIAQPFLKKEAVDSEVGVDFKSQVPSVDLKGLRTGDGSFKPSFKERCGRDSGTDTTSTFEPPSSNDDVASDGGTARLPDGKCCHIFVTHSTSDQQCVEKAIMGPLSGRWKTKACYHLMPDENGYDNEAIKDSMRRSCVIIIMLSTAYLQSGRCIKEWKLAVQLSREKVTVVVALASRCSRPDPLKKFLYLDLVGEDKASRRNAWDKLHSTLTERVQHSLSRRSSPSMQQKEKRSKPSNVVAHDNHHASSSPGKEPQNSGNVASYFGDSSMEETGQMVAEFESTWGENGATYEDHVGTKRSGMRGACQDNSGTVGDSGCVRDRTKEVETGKRGAGSYEEAASRSKSDGGYSSKKGEEGMEPGIGERTNSNREGGFLSSRDREMESWGRKSKNYEDEAMESEAMDSEAYGLETERMALSGEENARSQGVGLAEGTGTASSEGVALSEGDNEEMESLDQINPDQINSAKTVQAMDQAGASSRKSSKGKGSGVSGDVEEGEVSDDPSEEVDGMNSQETKSSDVALFYNNLARPDVDRRNLSPIRLMRNFNNWVKSILIRSYLKHCPNGCTALDLCCGKGGDLLKWKEGRIAYLACADISSESIIAAKERYHSDKMTGRDRRPPFSADFYVADCTKIRLADLASADSRFFHIVSCQFSLHYSFESYQKAHMMLRNACERLRPGGFFIGTTIDANQLVHRLHNSGNSENGSLSIGNQLFTVTLDPALDIDNLPLFGARYNFKLHGVVDLPEYLIYFPLLEKMLEQFDMERVLRQNFYDFFVEHRHNSEDKELLYRMEAFDKKTGTMSKGQWETVGLYLVYVFRKKPTS